MISQDIIDSMMDDLANINQAGDRLVQLEIDNGHKIISRDEYPWFSSDDWEEGVVSIDGKRVRIVAVMAKNPFNGAFSRMITGICKDGFIPVVVAPFDMMIFIMKKWGWHKRLIGHDYYTRQDQYFPTRKWIEKRIMSCAAKNVKNTSSQ